MSGKDDDRDDYDVGFGRPPRATQWKKGQSGNPSGARKKRQAKGSDSFADAVYKALQKRFQMPEERGGNRVPKYDLLAEVMVNAALSKNIGMVRLVLDQIDQAERSQTTRPQEDLSEAEAAIFEELLARLEAGPEAAVDDDPAEPEEGEP